MPPSKVGESSETETDQEVELTHEQYEDSLEFTFGKVKQSGPVKKAKGAGETRKRLVVGFFVLSWYVFPMFMHPLAVCIVNVHINISMQNESFHIQPKPFERTISNRVHRYLLQFLAFFILMPWVGPLERSIMEQSGFNAKEYPLLFAILYDEYHNRICGVLVCCSLIALMCAWRENSKTMRF